MQTSGKSLLLFTIFIIVVYLITKRKNTEHWYPYTQCPFGNWETAPNSAVFYPKARFRVPYEWPFKFESSYPVKHYRHYEQNY